MDNEVSGENAPKSKGGIALIAAVILLVLLGAGLLLLGVYLAAQPQKSAVPSTPVVQVNQTVPVPSSSGDLPPPPPDNAQISEHSNATNSSIAGASSGASGSGPGSSGGSSGASGGIGTNGSEIVVVTPPSTDDAPPPPPK
jgi:hypothetical protein